MVTADSQNKWKECFGRAPSDGYFKTTITDPEPRSKQGQVLHPEHKRILSVKELASSQGFPDSYKFTGTREEVVEVTSDRSGGWRDSRGGGQRGRGWGGGRGRGRIQL